MFDSARQDLHYTWRQLRHAPLFTVVASLSIAVGVIVAVSAFSLLNAVLFKPLPVPDADGFYHIYTSDFNGRTQRYGANSYRDYEDFAKSGAFATLAASRWQSLGVSVGGAPLSEQFVGFVSPNYFDVLGLRLQRGTTFQSGDQSQIVITHAYWQREFSGDPAVLGRTVSINAFPFTIVGVAPEAFHGVGLGAPIIGWAPAPVLPMILRNAAALQRGNRGFALFGRLPAGVTSNVAAARLNALAAALAEQEPEKWVDAKKETRLVSILSQKESLAPPPYGEALAIAVGVGALVVMFILLLACTNVAALLLGRAVGRQSEIALRMTLGATRGRLLRQLLTESLVLATIGGTASLIGLFWTIKYLQRRLPFSDMFDLRPDGRVLLAALVTTVVCALAFGLAPALQSLRVDLRARLSGSSTVQRNRLRGALIALQVAISSLLILLAFTAVRGVRSFVASNPGITLDGLVGVQFDMDALGRDTLRRRLYMVQAEELIATTPGVQSAALTQLMPLGGTYTGTELELPDGTKRETEVNTVGSAYFATTRMSALRGRVFASTDRMGSVPVAVVNEKFLQSYGQDLLGRLVKWQGQGIEIVGVVPEVDYHDADRPVAPLIYFVAEQFPSGSSRQQFLVRVKPGAEHALAAELTQRFRQGFPDRVPPGIRSVRDQIAFQTAPHRIIGRVALGLGGVELALASVGLYGLLLFALAARRREVGVRLALGATPRQATWAVMRHALTYAALGAAAGLLLAVPAAIVAQQAVPGARVTDPVPFVAALTAVLTAAGLAAYLPARKAGRLSPAVALKHAE